VPDLRFGIHSGQQHATFPEYLELWRFAEESGLDWASVFDHFQPIQSSNPEGPCFEGLTLLAAMAAHTTRLRCGVLVLGVTYRHPAVLAKAAATIDHISGGRLELGIGGAWHEEEHGEYGIPFPRIGVRLDMLDEACNVLRLLFTEHRASFEGTHFTLRDALAEPKPLQQPLPLWIGGSGERRTLRIVAEHASGWNTFGGDLDTFRHKLDVLKRHCDDVGRDPDDIRKQLVFNVTFSSDDDADRFVDELAPYLELGVRDVLILERPPADYRTIELFASRVAPVLR
jgi:F420-dependent oxidoreductase-like protein